MTLQELKMNFAENIASAGDHDRENGDDSFAVEDYRIAACLMEELRKDHYGVMLSPELVIIYLYLGDLYFAGKEYDTAEEYYQRAEQNARELTSSIWKDEESLDLLKICQKKRGYVAYYKKQPLLSEHWYRAALQTAKELYRLTGAEEDLAEIAQIYSSIGSIDQDHGTGIGSLERSLEIWKKLEEQNPSNSKYHHERLLKELVIKMMKVIHHIK